MWDEEGCVEIFLQSTPRKKDSHIKVKHIQYTGERRTKAYLTHSKFNNEMVSLLYNLRCQSVNEFRDNFHTQYGQTPICKICECHIDSQELALSCEKIKDNLNNKELLELNSLTYQDIYGDEEQQLKITKMYQRILQIRDTLSNPATGLPGLKNLGPDWLVTFSYWKYIYIYK